MEKVTYKNREKYALIARVIYGQILLPKKDQCYISESESNCLITDCIY